MNEGDDSGAFILMAFSPCSVCGRDCLGLFDSEAPSVCADCAKEKGPNE